MLNRQLRSLAVWLGVVPAVVGCYTYVPLDTSAGVQAGEHIAVEVTDRGRAELGDRLGTGVLRIEGTLTRIDQDDMVMNVWRVAQIGGVVARWSGESVRFRREYAASVQTRTLNRTKSWLAAGAATAGILAFALSQDLIGAFDSASEDDEIPPISSRGWWFY